MAVGYSDNRFDWCDELWRVKENHNFNEACNIVKNSLKNFAGIDKGFLNDVSTRANNTFKVTKYYFPVYKINAKVTYNWTTDSTRDDGDFVVTTTTDHTREETFTENFFSNIYDAVCPDTWVGRNDERFYCLSHVDDLNAKMYNSGCVWDASYAKIKLNDYCEKISPEKDATYLVNSWYATAIMVPVVTIAYTYNGQTFTSVVNLHNGESWINYMISQGVEKIAKQARTASLILRIVSPFIAAISLLVVNSFWSFVLSVVSVVICIVWSCVSGEKIAEYRNIYGKYGEKHGAKAVSSEIWQIIVTIVATVLQIIF